jgi:hypothetical protein
VAKRHALPPWNGVVMSVFGAEYGVSGLFEPWDAFSLRGTRRTE